MNAIARSTVGLVSAFAAVAALAGPAPAQTARLWRNALIEPKADAGFYLMSARRGFFEREGLRVETLNVKDDTIGIKALISGEVDSYLGTAGALAAVARGVDVKFLGCPWHGIPYVVLGRAGITKIEELRGKSIAASAPGTPPDMVAKAALTMVKIPYSEVKFAAVGADRERYNALLGGVVDAAVVSNEYLPLPSSKSINLLLAGKEALPKSIRFCALSTGKTVATRREDAIRFMTAEIKSFRYAVSHRDETIALTREVTDASPDDPRPAFIYDDAMKSGVVQPDFPVPVDKLVWMQQQLVELGQIPKVGGIEPAIETDIRAQALQRIGK
jgi:ABC-type nitrate/sulfonate/bicarbonate transport system substrate-binding protein